MEASQWLFRARAEALLADIKTLELNRSSWLDAQRLMTRWGKWGSWCGNCNAEDCTYNIQIYHLRFLYPSFVLEEGPHLGARTLELVGLRSGGVAARLHVAHGVVTSKEFRLDVTLPVSQWIRPGSRFWLSSEVGTYWPSLSVASSEDVNIPSSSSRSDEHPNRSFIQRRINLLASFTPNESPEERAALTDFHFNCITSWSPCASRRELLPSAEDEFEAESRRIVP